MLDDVDSAQKQPEETVALTVKLPACLVKRLKIRAVETDETMQSLAENYLERGLSQGDGR